MRGSVYFAAGSFEPEDFPDGRVDLHQHGARGERGDRPRHRRRAARGDGYHALSTAEGTVIFRRYRLDEDADEIARRIADFVARDPDPEIEGPVIIRGATTCPTA